MVLAIRDNNTLSANPNGEFTLAPGQMLVVMGSKQQLQDLRQILGGAIDAVEPMSGMQPLD
jgi:voltage-gated potassium channel